MKSNWYIIQTHSGFEDKVCSSIVEKSSLENMSDFIEEVFVPKQKIMEIKKGKKQVVEKSFFPGYVLIKMVMNNSTWQLVKSLPKVNGFLGSQDSPSIVSEADVNRVYKNLESDAVSPKLSCSFVAGDSVRIIDGPFDSFVGSVESIDESKGVLKVLVSIFGRNTPLDLEFVQVEKV